MGEALQGTCRTTRRWWCSVEARGPAGGGESGRGRRVRSFRSGSSLVPARYPIIVPRRRLIRYARVLLRRLRGRRGGHGHRWLSLRLPRLPRSQDMPLIRRGVLRRALRVLRKGVVRLLGLWLRLRLGYRWCWGMGVYGGHGWRWCLRRCILRGDVE